MSINEIYKQPKKDLIIICIKNKYKDLKHQVLICNKKEKQILHSSKSLKTKSDAMSKALEYAYTYGIKEINMGSF